MRLCCKAPSCEKPEEFSKKPNNICDMLVDWLRWNWNQLQSCVQLFAVHQNLWFCFRKPYSHVWAVKSKISQAHYRKENSCCNRTMHHTGHAFFISLPCPVMIHIWVFFPNGDVHEQIAQPVESRSDIDSGQNDVFFLSYCYVFFNIRVRIWVFARFSRGILYRKLQAKLENYLLKYSLKPLWSVQWTKPPEYLFLWWLKHGILLNL